MYKRCEEDKHSGVTAPHSFCNWSLSSSPSFSFYFPSSCLVSVHIFVVIINFCLPTPPYCFHPSIFRFPFSLSSVSSSLFPFHTCLHTHFSLFLSLSLLPHLRLLQYGHVSTVAKGQREPRMLCVPPWPCVTLNQYPHPTLVIPLLKPQCIYIYQYPPTPSTPYTLIGPMQYIRVPLLPMLYTSSFFFPVTSGIFLWYFN